MADGAELLDGRYLLDEVVGAGGYCTVWRATDTVLTRPVAVKLLHAAHAHQPEARARLKAEALHAGALAHENIARVYDYGEPERGQCYLVMELIEGPSLEGVLADGPLDVARTMDIVAQVATGLQAAHSAGLIHRDIKPANIMVTPEGTVRITDFGVAHSVGSVPLTATGTMVGSAAYIAPERVAGSQGGPASDLYALGIVAYECLAGARPFEGPPSEITTFPVTEGQRAVATRTHADRLGRRLPLKAAVVVLAALCGLAVLTVTGLMPDSRPAFRPTPATPSVTAPASTASPAGSQPAGPHPVTSPNTSIRELAASTETTAGPPGQTKHLTPGDGPPSAQGKGQGRGH